LLDDDEEPPGLLDEDDELPPLPEPMLPLEEPLMLPVEELPMPLPLLEELPVSVDPGVVLLELDVPGELGEVVDDDEVELPGTTTVSFFSVVVLELVLLPLGAVPGTTVVLVSLRSHAESASAPRRTTK
jgi:hypothetical protein